MTHEGHSTLLQIGLLVLAVAVAALAAPGPASATHTLFEFQSALEALWTIDPTINPPPDDGHTDFAVGGFQGPEDNNFGFSGHSGPLGEDPQGHLSETIHGVFQGRFRVTCLMVAGNQAALRLVLTEAASNDAVSEFVLSVFDSGIAGGAGDRFAFIETAAEDCAAFVSVAAAGGFFIERGNLVVHDAIP